MDKVKKAIRAGVGATMAIRSALGQQDPALSFTAFAEKYDLSRTKTASQLNLSVVADEPLIRALITELGGTVEEWVEVLTIRPKIALESVG